MPLPVPAAKMDPPKMIGKAELVSWAAEATGIHPSNKYEDFKDGLIFVTLFDMLFPGIVDMVPIRAQRNGTRNAKSNWETLRNAAMSVGLPVSVIDRKSVMAGQHRPIYNLLVMFFFLTKLTTASDFTVDFAHPIDDSLSDFLQSADSLECLSRFARHPAPPRRGSANGLSPQQQGGEMVPPVSSPSGGRSNADAPGPTAPPTAHRWHANETHQDPEWGETTILRLQSALTLADLRIKYLDEEAMHLGEAYAARLDSERALWESDLLRERRNADHTRVLLHIEHVAALRKVRLETDQQLQRVYDDIALTRDASLFGRGGSGDDHAVLLQRVSVLEAQLGNAQQQLQEQARVLEEQRHEMSRSRQQLEEMAQSYRDVATRLAAQDLIPDAIFDTLGPHEQASLVRHVKAIKEELGASLASRKRLELEIDELKKSATETAGTVTLQRGREGHPSSTLEQSRLHASLQRANMTIALLTDAMQRIKMGDTVLRDFFHDYAADQLGSSVDVPSVFLKAQAPGSIASELHATVAAMASELKPECFEQLRTVSWKHCCALMALQHRVERSAATITALYQDLTDAERRVALQRHEADTRIDELTRQAARSADDATRAAQRQLSELQLALELTRRDCDRLRADAKATHDRMQANLTAAMQDADQQLQNLRQRLARSRDGSVEERDTPTPRHLQERLDACIADLREAQHTQDELQTKLNALTIELDQVKAQAARDREARQEAEDALEKAKKESRDAFDRLAVAQSTSRMESEQYKERIADLEGFVRDLQQPEGRAKEVLGQGPDPRSSKERPSTTDRVAHGLSSLLNDSREIDLSSRTVPRSSVGRLAVPPPSTPMTLASLSSKPAAKPAASETQQQQIAPSVLSQDELERRKMEILAKYGVKPTSTTL